MRDVVVPLKVRMTVCVDCDHNVYILGAGFSKGRGLPLTADFLNAIRDAYAAGSSLLKSELDALRGVLELRRRAAAAAARIELDEENIEDLFSYALAQDPQQLDVMPWALTAALNHRLTSTTMATARLVCPSTSPLPYGCARDPASPEVITLPNYSLVIGVLAGLFHAAPSNVPAENSFITFNYDLLVEEALRNTGRSFSYCFGKGSVNYEDGDHSTRQLDSSTIRVLKLHGSMNWGRVSGGGRQFTIFRNYDDLRRAPGIISPVLVPPTWHKLPEDQLQYVWQEALAVLSRATRIVIAGYSFPATDVHVRYLLAAALEQNIALRNVLIINPSADDGDFRQRVFGIFRERLLRLGMIRLQPSTLEDALARRVGEWFGRRVDAPYGAMYPAGAVL